MRRACNDVGFLFEEDRGGLIGIGLGYDHCAEHEWGTKGINKQLGIGEGGTEGVDRMMATNTDGVEFFTKGDEAFLITGNVGRYTKHDGSTEGKVSSVLAGYIKTDHQSIKRRFKEDGNAIGSCWAEDNFIVMVKGQKYVDQLKQIYDLFVAGKMTKRLVRLTPFGGGGLVFISVDAYTAEEKQNFIDHDRSHERLTNAVAKTKIEKKLEDAGLRYFALSPRWTDEKETDIQYWLNPTNQNKNNYGWFTLAQLEAWIKGKGPIPKT